ncbi:MAG: aldehyde dehydrogenase [Bacteroidales bacterium]|nr:aldehyde dehydrogenase [Bacteroidales bacterium]
MNRYTEIIEKQRLFFYTNQTKSIDFRKKQLLLLRDALRKNEHILEQAIYADFKKSKFDTFTNELALLYLDIREALKKLPHWAKTKKVRTNLINFPAKSFIVPEPLGVCLIIGAWNYPIQLSLAPAIAAIAAGNTIILKPSELSSNTSSVIAQIIKDTFEPSYFTVIEGGVEETTLLLENKFDKIFFTGSVPVGKIVYQAAAQQLTPVTLELGGKSPTLILPDANLKIAAKRIAWAKFLNAGQTCIAPDYLLVHQQIKDKFLAYLVDEIKQAKYSIDAGNYVQIINERNFNRLINLIDKEKIFYGGIYQAEKRIIEPTILCDVDFNHISMQDEIFGPILPVIVFNDLQAIINEIKQRPHPLSCYVYTENKKTAKNIIHQLSFGGGAINDSIMHITNSRLPFGGVGNSGIGSYHGKAGFDAFTHYKSILSKPTFFEPNFKYSPYSDKKLQLIRKFMRI